MIASCVITIFCWNSITMCRTLVSNLASYEVPVILIWIKVLVIMSLHSCLYIVILICFFLSWVNWLSYYHVDVINWLYTDSPICPKSLLASLDSKYDASPRPKHICDSILWSSPSSLPNWYPPMLFDFVSSPPFVNFIEPVDT